MVYVTTVSTACTYICYNNMRCYSFYWTGKKKMKLKDCSLNSTMFQFKKNMREWSVREMEKLTQSCKKCSCRICLVPPWGFKDLEEEKLYSTYTQQQRQKAVPHLLTIGVLLQAFSVVVPGERDMAFAYISIILASFANLTLVIVYTFCRSTRPVLNHVVWLVLWIQLLVSGSRRLGDSYNELLGWAVVLQYFTLATLPLHYLILILYSALSFSAYLQVQFYNAYTSESRLPDDFYLQVGWMCKNYDLKISLVKI